MDLGKNGSFQEKYFFHRKVNMNKSLFFRTIIVFFLLTSCHAIKNPSTVFNETGQSDLYIEYPPNVTKYVNNEIINLWITNNTGEIIWFPVDFGIKIFVYDTLEEKWCEINNGMEYFPKNKNVLLLPKQEKFNTGGISLLPIIPEKYFSNLHKAIIKLSITGYKYIDDKKTNQQVSGNLIFEISKE